MKRALTLALPTLAIVLAAAVLFTLIFRQNTACTQVEDVRTAVRTILTYGKAATIVSPDLTPAQRTAAVAFYDKSLVLVQPHHC